MLFFLYNERKLTLHNFHPFSLVFWAVMKVHCSYLNLHLGKLMNSGSNILLIITLYNESKLTRKAFTIKSGYQNNYIMSSHPHPKKEKKIHGQQ